mmetsp:Transcript_11687/g.27044  ORF Transcript_11687/g.27044 Transcript_11687/m.27044 type:complete len:204 (+) Transcript_11687:462-1073(+)
MVHTWINKTQDNSRVGTCVLDAPSGSRKRQCVFRYSFLKRTVQKGGVFGSATLETHLNLELQVQKTHTHTHDAISLPLIGIRCISVSTRKFSYLDIANHHTMGKGFSRLGGYRISLSEQFLNGSTFVIVTIRCCDRIDHHPSRTGTTNNLWWPTGKTIIVIIVVIWIATTAFAALLLETLRCRFPLPKVCHDIRDNSNGRHND